LQSSLHAIEVNTNYSAQLFFWLCEECKPHYIPNIFCLSPQLMRIQTRAEIARRNFYWNKDEEIVKILLCILKLKLHKILRI
jgi:hypothetical protein